MAKSKFAYETLKCFADECKCADICNISNVKRKT